ncbi:MAG: hypothetical protein K2N94_12305, partial [Lachnospiraceae bacterium]|nr:hypothetical protein [Lachnospiraceae bacterium]
YVAHCASEATKRWLDERRPQFGGGFRCLYGAEYETAYLVCRDRLRGNTAETGYPAGASVRTENAAETVNTAGTASSAKAGREEGVL